MWNHYRRVHPPACCPAPAFPSGRAQPDSLDQAAGRVVDFDAVGVVAGNQVARAEAGSADRHRGAAGDVDTVAGVAQGGRAAGRGADPVAGDHVAVRVIVVHAIARVARDHIARAGGCAADRVSRRSGNVRAVDGHPIDGVAQCNRSRDIGADPISFDNDIGSIVGNSDSDRISRNHVALAGGGTADGIGESVSDQDAVIGIARN